MYRGCLVILILVFTVLSFGSVEGAPTNQRLLLDNVISNELYDNRATPGSTSIMDVLNHDITTTDGDNYDGSPGTLWWSNASSAGTGSWGTGRIVLSLANLTGELSDYYNITVTVYGILMDSDESAIIFSGYSEALSYRVGLYSEGDYGWGHYYTGTGISPTDYPGEYAEVARMTSTPTIQSWQSHTCSIMNDDSSRPWSSGEVDEMLVVIDLRCDSGLWPYWAGYDVLPVRFTLTEVYVNAVPVSFAEPTTPDVPSDIPPDAISYIDIGILGYLMPFMMLMFISGVAAFTNKSSETISSMNIFLLVFIIGISIMIWVGVFPIYLMLIPILMLGAIIFRGNDTNE